MVYYFYVYLFVLLMLLIFIYTTISHWTKVYVCITTKYDFRTPNPQILQIMMRMKTGDITFHVGNILYAIWSSYIIISLEFPTAFWERNFISETISGR